MGKDGEGWGYNIVELERYARSYARTLEEKRRKKRKEGEEEEKKTRKWMEEEGIFAY
jgi:hypothetical protein